MSFCSEPFEPEFFFDDCPAVSVGGRHSEAYGNDGEWICDWCGKRPFWPVQPCRLFSLYDFNTVPSRYPNLCEAWS